MAATGSLHHIDISVGDPERSILFYDAFFTALGYKRWELDLPEWLADVELSLPKLNILPSRSASEVMPKPGAATKTE